MRRIENGIIRVPEGGIVDVAERIVKAAWENSVPRELAPLTYHPTSALEDWLISLGFVFGMIGAGLTVNEVLKTGELPGILAIPIRSVALAALSGIGGIVGAGHGWLAAKAINGVRSRFS